MFTLKFISHFENSQTETCIECPHYEAYRCSDNSYRIVCYEDFTAVDGVERIVHNDPKERDAGSAGLQPYWHVCYVQNEAGKTIAHYHQPDDSLCPEIAA